MLKYFSAERLLTDNCHEIMDYSGPMHEFIVILD